MRLDYIVGGIVLLVIAAIGFALWWTVVCCLAGIICGIIGAAMFLYGLIAKRHGPVTVGRERLICPHCYRTVERVGNAWYCRSCRRWL